MEIKKNNIENLMNVREYEKQLGDVLNLSEKQFHTIKAKIDDYDIIHTVGNRLRKDINLIYSDGKNTLGLGRFEKDDKKNSYKLVANKCLPEKGLEIMGEIMTFAKEIQSWDY